MSPVVGVLVLWAVCAFLLSARAGPLLPPALAAVGLAAAGLVAVRQLRAAALVVLAMTLVGMALSGGVASPWLVGLLVPPALMLARSRQEEALEFAALGLAGFGTLWLVEALGLGTGVRIADATAVGHTALAGLGVLGVLLLRAWQAPAARTAPDGIVPTDVSGFVQSFSAPVPLAAQASVQPGAPVLPGLTLTLDVAERIVAFSGSLPGYTPRIAERFRHAGEDPEALGLWLSGLAGGGETETVFRLGAPLSANDAEPRPAGPLIHVRALADTDRGGWTLFLQDAPARPDLASAVAAAQAERDARTVFFASLGHDLKTPLNAIIGFSDLMRQGWLGPLSDAYKERAALIHESSQDLLLMVDDILDLARTDAGQYRIVPEPVDLLASGWGVMRMLADMATRKRVKLRVRRGAVVEAMADPRAVRQIWQNLLSNALKYGGEGGEIIAGASQREGMAVLYVEDKGPGMSAEEVARIGTPFAQGSLAGPASGSGLGLALVQRFAQLHGGRIDIRSAKGEGTRVEVWLPLAVEEVGALEDVLPQSALDAAE
jgi:cell cycle sensor histidine kinase DivJ